MVLLCGFPGSSWEVLLLCAVSAVITVIWMISLAATSKMISHMADSWYWLQAGNSAGAIKHSIRFPFTGPFLHPGLVGCHSLLHLIEQGSLIKKKQPEHVKVQNCLKPRFRSNTASPLSHSVSQGNFMMVQNAEGEKIDSTFWFKESQTCVPFFNPTILFESNQHSQQLC